ncbi:hypothetical protein ACFX1X_012633 [Malus domestica]
MNHTQSSVSVECHGLGVLDCGLGKEKKKEIMASSECCSNPPALNPSSGSGHVEKLGGFDSYVTGSPDSRLSVLLVHDAFDKIAAAGFIVVLPDFFNGDPFNGDHASIPVWRKTHAPEKTIEDAKLVIEALRSKGVSAIGAAGFCWGTKGVIDLAKHDFIQAAVLCHPSSVTLDDIKAVKVPISVLGAEIDQMYPPEVIKQFEEVLTAKPEIKSHVKIFPKVVHGWTLRYDDEDEAAVKAAGEAHQDLLGWFLEHVK